MANEKIMLNAKAKTLGIEGYRQMTPEALKAAIASAEGKSKGTTSKGKTAASAPVKGKAAPAPKTPAAKGKVSATTAKGKTASTTKTASAKGKNTSTTQKSEAAPAKAAKGAASRAGSTKPKTAPKASKGSENTAVVNKLDLKGIDWKAECGVGKQGKRAEVLAALRKTKNYGKAFALLQPSAKKFYPGKDKHAAERMLVWLIGRVAYDFAVATDQHEPGVRAAYGTSNRPQDVKRRETRAANPQVKGKNVAAKKTTKKATPAKKTAAAKATAPKGKAAGKTQPAKSAPKKSGSAARTTKGSTAKGKGKR